MRLIDLTEKIFYEQIIKVVSDCIIIFEGGVSDFKVRGKEKYLLSEIKSIFIEDNKIKISLEEVK